MALSRKYAYVGVSKTGAIHQAPANRWSSFSCMVSVVSGLDVSVSGFTCVTDGRNA